MQYRSVKGISGLGQLAILLAFTVVGYLLAGVVLFAIVIPVMPPGKMAEDMLKVLMRSENVGRAQLAQVLSTFFSMFVPALLYLIVCHGRNKFWLGFNKHINGWQILIGFSLIFLANLIAEPLATLSHSLVSHAPGLDAVAQRMENTYNEQIAVISNLKSWPEFLMAIVIIAFFPAMVEEIFFRGALQNILVRWWKAPLIGIIVTSILFSLIHLSVYLFLSRVVLGFVLGLMYERSKNIWVNIIAHFLNNALVLAFLFWHIKDAVFPLWISIAATGVTYGLFLVFEKVSLKNRIKVALEEQELLDKNSLYHAFPETQNE